MQSLEVIDPFILKEAKKQSRVNSMKATFKFNKGLFPIDENFVCPYCKYEPSSAKIFSDTKLFCCFNCNERRRL